MVWDCEERRKGERWPITTFWSVQSFRVCQRSLFYLDGPYPWTGFVTTVGVISERGGIASEMCVPV